ncbi:AAA domain-containing protein [Cellulophaga sp. E6(2014)]|uniref:AAA domain-containing protein n=1 Tax=Cellulophaga sp. E6(2014) TaxID=1495334 RepID=UPI00051CE33A|nr:AAA domain-containing protein [Cellulophaga sp. E6(2014)]KGK30529.1 hypothetical protein EL45_08945 [Cellulophaga sp. E6(2014)]
MEHKKWLSYWKKSLSDALKANIDVERLPHFEIENFEIERTRVNQVEKVNKIIDIEEIKINKKKGITNAKSDKWLKLDVVVVVISPIKIKPTPEHLVFLKDKKPKFPFWFYAQIDREGNLKVPEETFPAFQRKYLEPLADERTEFIFGSVDKVDKATAIGKESFDSYVDYIKYLESVFNEAIGQELKSYVKEGYETIHNGIVLLPDEDMNAAIGIIHLYEKILEEKNIPALLKSFITLRNDVQNPPVKVKDLINSNEMHVGQMGNDFPISISQRTSLNSFLTTNDKVFAINGPPGTGKTTLLQSIVGNMFVESAIEGNKAPIILACSTNNQAVTNIIDSFSKSTSKTDELIGRWIPEIEGYATYLPSSGKTDAELKGINYKKLRGDGLFVKVESQDFLRKAKLYFEEKSEAYFNIENLTIKEATNKLQKQIIETKAILKNAAIKWKDYLQAEDLFSSGYDTVSNDYFKDGLLNQEHFKLDIERLKQLEKDILNYFKTESFFRKLFCFFGFKTALASRASELRIILRGSLIKVSEDFRYSRHDILESIDFKLKMAATIIVKINNWKAWKNTNAIHGNPPKTTEEYWGFELLKIRNNTGSNCFYDELDISFRFKAFQLALHFWEGKYLMNLENDLTDPKFDSKGASAVMNRWQRQAQLTPCFVSTFYMAPKFFSSFKFLKKGEDGKNIFDNPPLFNFIDLLIVDEAGQVSPEVGIATFALAKQAVIVGDVKQIEPVWNITNKIDVGNLNKVDLIRDYDDLIYESEFEPKGFLSSSGSIMKMAQNACNFKEKESNEKGVLLVEHRRCYDEIINYCNVLAYNGQLVPLKGKAKNDLLFPPMYCIHVNGNSKVVNSSRQNQNEVNAIVNWLIENKDVIKDKYGKIEESIGIITPFVGQKNSLKSSLREAGFNTQLMKIGTVHALQGAERHIIIFSMVYGKGDSGSMFFDRDNKPNMLNVAVSRAKDNFIVFANTEILNNKAKTPSGILANHLVYKDTPVTS